MRRIVCQRDIVSETFSLLLAPNFSQNCFSFIARLEKIVGQVTRWLPLVDGKAKSDNRGNQADDRTACDDGGAAKPRHFPRYNDRQQRSHHQPNLVPTRRNPLKGSSVGLAVGLLAAALLLAGSDVVLFKKTKQSKGGK
jgi:hypothetical protein